MMSHNHEAWDALGPAEREAIFAKLGRFRSALEADGKYVSSFGLQDPRTAKTVRQSTDGHQQVVDEPFSGTGEAMGGLYVIEADSLEEAVEWGRRGRFMAGANEVRQLAD
jgi:hypothetical protein